MSLDRLARRRFLADLLFLGARLTAAARQDRGPTSDFPSNAWDGR